MSTTTPNLGLFKYNPTTDGKEVFSIQTALNDNWDKLDNLDAFPDQTGKAGYILTTNGSDASWGQTGEIYPVIETYQNGTSWYRVYSDGWCEQGASGVSITSGQMAIYFLKPFLDNHYTLITEINGVTSTSYGEGVSVQSKLTDSFLCHGYHSSAVTAVIADWYACGYIS